jgi:putative transposase
MVTTLQRLHLSYAWYHRRVYRTSDNLWQGRYKSLPILDDPYLLEAGRYIERNPLEAKLAEKPELYPWSSYRHTALGHPDPLITPSPAYLGLAPISQARQLAWQQYVTQTRLYQSPSTQQLAGVFQGW